MPKKSRRVKFKAKTEKVYKSLQYIPTDNITELNELIYAWTKLFSDKISIPIKILSRNTKAGWEKRLKVQINHL